jgi:diguanylate cyclase (GGDEF)-like protein/PAS domain S-box-containing protein
MNISQDVKQTTQKDSIMERTVFETEHPRVLIVDDDLPMRLLGRRSLEKAGFVVEEAENGEIALSSFKRHRFDAVLLDVSMPGIDGFTVCEEIRKLPGGELIPIIMVTGLDDIESIKRAYKVGASDFISKDLDWEVVSYHLKYMLRASGAFVKLGKSKAKNRALLNAIPDLMFRVRKEGIILEYKESEEIQSLMTSEELLGRRLDEVFPKDFAEKTMYFVEQTLQTGIKQIFEYQLNINDVIYHYETRIVLSGEDEVLAIVRDINERKRAEQQIIRLAFYDYLTGLPNRLLFKDRLEQAIASAQRYGKKVAVMFIDLDFFKRINDTFGHNVGDMLLKSAADRILKCTRRVDYVSRISTEEELEKTVARMGGDEFTILLSNIDDIQDASKVGQRILNEISQPFKIGAYDIHITASIGITIYPIDTEDPDDLLKYADIAMYQVKDKGRNNYQFYAESMNAATVE